MVRGLAFYDDGPNHSRSSGALRTDYGIVANNYPCRLELGKGARRNDLYAKGSHSFEFFDDNL